MKQLTPLLFFLAVSFHSTAQTFDTAYVDGSLYAKLYDTSTVELNLFTPPLSLLVSDYGIDTMYWPFRGYNIPLDQVYRLEFSEIAKTDSLIAALQALNMIEYAEKVPLAKSDAFTPDDLHPNQGYLTKIQAQQAWNISQGSAQVVIAIIDNGVKLAHEDLAANIWMNPGEIPNNGIDDDLNGRRDDIHGFDIADNNNNPNPPAGISNNSGFNHGSHCAGIASAVTNNSKGIASIGFKAKIMAVKVARNSGSDRELSHAYEGVFYAMRAGADIISMSFGGSNPGITAQSVINAAFASGIVLVAAAGNEATDRPAFPAAFPNVISVGATDNNDRIASFSNFGSTVDVMAPGVNILSTLAGTNDSYGFLSGTSMACPIVAGLAGLALSLNPGMSPTQTRNAIIGGCDNITAQNPGFSGQIGAGRINAFKTLSLVAGTSSMEERDAKSERRMSVYPNPFDDCLKIKMQGIFDAIVEIAIFDGMGKRVYAAVHEISGNEINLSLADLPAGIYIMRTVAGSEILMEKIFKTH